MSSKSSSEFGTLGGRLEAMKPKPVFADPKTDVIFKKIFGQKAHKNLLLELLNSLLELDEAHRIVDIDYLTPEQLPPRHDLKLSILDVKCTDARGTHYVVEMQVIAVEGFQKRVVYNACKAYVLQLGAGGERRLPTAQRRDCGDAV